MKAPAVLACLAFVALCHVAHAQNGTTPITTASPMATPVPVSTAEPLETAEPVMTNPPATPTSTTRPAASAPPPVQRAPPPPPGAGSSKTAVLSVIDLVGTDLKTFNSTIGDKFTAAMAKIYGISSSSIVIRKWGNSGRRLHSDTTTVASAALFSNGIQAASGLATLSAAADSGALQEALQAAGLPVESLDLQSAVTAVPSNFQPLDSQGKSIRLHALAIAVIAIIGGIVLGTLVFCCCRQCFCCCRQRSGEEEEEDKEGRLPKMIKYGSHNGGRVAEFHNTQQFKTTSGTKGRLLAELQESHSTA